MQRLPELRKHFITFQAVKSKQIEQLDNKKLETALRLLILAEIKRHPEIKLSHNQMRFDKFSALMARIRYSKRLKVLNLAASKFQATFKAFIARNAYLKLRRNAIVIQRWYKMLKIAKTWNFTEAMRNLKEKSASTIQKYLRGYSPLY